MSDLTPMQPSNDKTRTRKRIDALERLVRKLAAAPLRNATIDGPVVVSHRGVVKATSPDGSTTSLSGAGAVSTAEDGTAVRLAGGTATTQAGPGEPWVPITADAEAQAQEALDAAAQAVLDAAGAQASAGQAIVDAAAATTAATNATTDAAAASSAASQAATVAAAAQDVADAAQAAADAAAADASGASGDAATAQAAANAAQTKANAAAAAAAAAASAAATADSKAVAAQSAAAAAQSTADGALLAANAAQAAANGKSTITYSEAEPSGTAPENSTWFRFTDGVIIGQWKRASGSWVPQTIDNAVIANLDAGKLTAGIINAALVIIRTAASGSRVVFNGSGLVGYDADGVVKTVIDAATGKITAVDGTFTGTVFGSAIVGGSIAIAQGTTSTTTQDWETASGTTPPSGWTRTVINNSGAIPLGIDFPTGGNPGRAARMQLTVMPVPENINNNNNQTLASNTITGRDFDVTFDYKWSGDKSASSIPRGFMGVVFRGDKTKLSYLQPAGFVGVDLSNGWMRATDTAGFYTMVNDTRSTALAKDVWYRFRIEIRGTALTITRRKIAGDVLVDVLTVNLAGAPGSGGFHFACDSRYDQTLNQSVMIDNLVVNVLKTGLAVNPDGSTDVERITVGAWITVPDALMPTDAVNKRLLEGRTRRKSVTFSAAVGTVDRSVTFDTPYPAGVIPTVLVSFGSANIDWLTGCSVTGASNTGFTLRTRNTFSAAITTEVNYFATV